MLAKRFAPLTTFRQSESSGYRLLPFRFTALDDQRYVATNLVGEHVVLRRPDVEDLVHHRVPAGSPLYDSLKSRHFLLDDDSNVARDLLALKYRTKLHRVAQFTGLHIFVVTLRCDYSCGYCQVSRQSEDKGAFDMTREMADKALALTFRSPSPNIKIEFQGGEPLLNFDLIRYIVDAAEDMNRTQLRNLAFVITTNLSYINDDILDYADTHGIYFSTSLDGPASIHDRNRPRPGKDGHALTVHAIRRIQARLGVDRVSALMTTTVAGLACPEEIVDEYVRIGFREIFLRPLSPYGFAVKTGAIDKYNAERWLAFYKRGLAHILDLNRNGYHFVEAYTALIARKILTHDNAGFVDLQSPAGAGISAVVYNYDGDVYASDEARMLAEMGDKTFRLGSLLHDSYEDIYLSDTLLDTLESTVTVSVPGCVDCAFLPYCGADPVYHHATQGDMVGNKALSGFCHKNMGIFRHVISLMEDDPAARDIITGWALGC